MYLTHRKVMTFTHMPLLWRHYESFGISNHRRLDCLVNRLFRHRSKQTSKLRVTGLFEGDPPVTDEFPAQRTSNAENVSIWWRHHGDKDPCLITDRAPGWGPCQYAISRLILLSRPGALKRSYRLVIWQEHIVVDLSQHWFSWLIVACSVPSH